MSPAAIAKRKAPAARVYSYIRFSTPEQKLGDSERRQVEKAKAWAKRKGLTLDETLVDEGRSGFKGTHRKQGHLGRFLARVLAGDVPRGSYLVVENADRLSREGLVTTVVEVIDKLWKHGVTIVTLSPEEEYPPGCDREAKFIAFTLYLQRGQDESERKRDRAHEAWKDKRGRAREDGHLLTKKIPAWLRFNAETKKLEFVPGAKETIKCIFKMRLEGMGKEPMARRLNADGAWHRGKWGASYIEKILRNPSTHGAFQPCIRQEVDVEGVKRQRHVPEGETIPDYFPAAIDKETFDAVQRTFKRQGQRGRNGKEGNLLRGLAYCAYCSGPCHFDDKGSGPKGGQKLICGNYKSGRVCSARVRPGCKRHETPSMSYPEIEGLVLSLLDDIDPKDVLPPSQDEESLVKAAQDRLTRIGEDIAQARRVIAARQRILDESLNDAEVKVALAAVARQEERIAQLEEQQGEACEALRKVQGSREKFTKAQAELKSVRDLLAKRPKDGELRRRVRTILSEIVERIVVFPYGYAEQTAAKEDVTHTTMTRTRGSKVRDVPVRMTYERPLGEDLAKRLKKRDDVPAEHKDPAWLAFLTERRMSQHGRFIRVEFPNGASRELIPEGSIALERYEVWSDAVQKQYELWYRRYRPAKNPTGPRKKKAGA